MREANINARARKIRFAMFFFCLMYLAATANGQSRSTISGFVFDQQRQPVGQVQVELLTDVNSTYARVRTDSSGRFYFTGIPHGRFTIKVIPVGTNFEPKTEEVEIFGVGADGRQMADNVQKDIYLRLRNSGNGGVTGATFVQEIPEAARKSYEQAVDDLEDKKVEKGIEGLENSIKIYPNYYSALEKLGNVYIEQKKYEDARGVLSRAVAVNARSFSGWYGLSYANYILRNIEPAIEAARKAVELNSTSANAHFVLGVSLRHLGKFNEAESSLKQAKKITEGKSPDIIWNLALLYAHDLKRYKDAADELELYIKVNPDNPDNKNLKKLIKQFRENPPAAKE